MATVQDEINKQVAKQLGLLAKALDADDKEIDNLKKRVKELMEGTNESVILDLKKRVERLEKQAKAH